MNKIPNIEMVDSSEYHKNWKTQTKFYGKKVLTLLFKHLFSKKGLLFIVWFSLLYYLGVNDSAFLNTYVVFSGIGFIMCTLDFGERKKGKLSAYSIFNKG